MRIIATLAAATIGFSLLTALPAFAQPVFIGLGRPRPLEPYVPRDYRSEYERARAFERGRQDEILEQRRKRREEERARAYEEGRRDAQREQWRKRREAERFRAYEEGRLDAMRDLRLR
jgi:flagellar biosynthesis/type III secretory pathway protein FliH